MLGGVLMPFKRKVAFHPQSHDPDLAKKGHAPALTSIGYCPRQHKVHTG
jgi:hypothetical protein